MAQELVREYFQDTCEDSIPLSRFEEERRLPAKESLRKAILLKFVAEHFEVDKVYQEKEVSEIINRIYDDYCSVRRYLIDYSMMSRSNGKYWVST